MNTVTYWEAVAGIAAVGFAVCWLTGLCIGIWCFVSLGV